PGPGAGPRRGRAAAERCGRPRSVVHRRGLRQPRPSSTRQRGRHPTRAAGEPPDGRHHQPRRRAQEADPGSATRRGRRPRQHAAGAGQRVNGSVQSNLFADTGGEKARYVILAADPLATARAELSRKTVLTPNDRAARALGGGRATSVSLSTRAMRSLRSNGILVSLPLSRLLALRQVIADDGGWPDVRGTARRLEPVVSELLRAGIAVEARSAAAIAGNAAVGPRTERVVRLALAYSQLLRDNGEVDAAEALWQAATAIRSREPLLVYGYSRLGAGEVAFVDAL